MITRFLAAGVALFFATVSANAATITKTYDITASNFVNSSGDSTVLPVSPVHLNFTISFDNSADIQQTTNGLTINSFNLPLGSNFAYWAGGDTLTIATYSNPASCAVGTAAYCFFIEHVSSASPVINIFDQVTSSSGIWSSPVVFTVSDGATVPEPATWALMIGGFAMVGAAARRRRQPLAA